MYTKTIPYAVIVMAISVSLLFGFQRTASENTKTWQYRVIGADPYISNKDLESQLNQAGKENWELVAVEGSTSNNVGRLRGQYTGDPQRILTS